MRKLLRLSVCVALVFSFLAVGCSEESCKDLLRQLNSLQNDIIDVANKRREMDAKGTPGTANEAAQLKELEDEQEELNGSLLALTSHFAQVLIIITTY